MIVLKHLSREYNIDPHKLRQLLRSEFHTTTRRRWRWNEEAKRDMNELTKIRQFLNKRRGQQ